MNQIIIIPDDKISCSPDGSRISITLEESYLFLLKQLILSSSKKKFIYLSSAKESTLETDYSSMIIITKFLYQTAFHYFSQTKLFLFDVNIIFESLNFNFLNDVVGQQVFEILYLAEQKNKIRQFLQSQADKRIKETEVIFDRLEEDTTLGSCKFSALTISNPQAQLRVALGGTFDHLHIGHKILLSVAAFAAKRSLVCGVMDPSTLAKKKFHELLEPLETRIQNVNSFLKLVNPNLACEIVPIFDAFGPTLTDPSIDTLVVSQETSSGGDLVNLQRVEKGFSPLEIITVEVISLSPSKTAKEIIDAKVSSTSIREQLSKNTDC